MKTLPAAFIAAKRTFGPALKDKNNPHFKSKYADLGACIEAVEDALLANGIAFYQETFDDSTGVTVETVFMHESGETLRCGKLHVPAAKQDPQGYGSALTYCRRYSLMAACGIAPEDDDGNAASKAKPASAIPATFKSSPTKSVNDVVPPSRKAVLDDCAEEIKDRFNADDLISAYEIASDITDVEEKTFLWGLLPSNVRSAFKKHSESLKAEATA